ncbi:12376_t:CDS:2, partial [Racocetra fulgida]
TNEQRKACLVREREQKQQRQMKHIIEPNTNHMDHQEEIAEVISDNTESEMISVIIESNPLLDTILNVPYLSETDHKLLQKFRAEMNKLKHNSCPVCNERFPSINLVNGECHRCYNDKNELKKFSLENNMDPGDVSEELKGLTDIEEMLIAQIFPVISVYYLRDGQYAYRGNENDVNEEDYLDNDHDSDNKETITYNFVSTLVSSHNEDRAISATLARMQDENNPAIMWPNIDSHPINEFNTPDYIACTFLSLYPTGNANLRAEHVRE